MIYLASPYSHRDPAVEIQRFEAACQAAAALLQQGRMVFSPVAHSHPIAACGLPKDWRYWSLFDSAFVEMCDEVWVLMLPGWEDSVGVRAEIKRARDLNKPVKFVEPETLRTQNTPASAGASGSEV